MSASVLEVMTGLRDLMSEAFDPLPSRISLVPGAAVAWDEVCGQVWVRLVMIQPAVPQVPTSCFPPRMRVTLGLGVLRCVKSMDNQGNAPSAAVLNAEAEQMARDVQAVLTVANCGAMKDYQLMQLNTLGPEGGMAGSEWLITTTLDN